MKQTLCVLMAILITTSLFAQTNNDIVDVNNTLLLTAGGILFTNDVPTIEYFNKDIWLTADLRLSDIEGKELYVAKYKVENKFGEMVPADKPWVEYLLAKDAGDMFMYPSGAITKDREFFYSYNSISDSKDYFSYTIVLLPSSIVFYKMNGDKYVQRDVILDDNQRVSELASHTYKYDENGRISQVVTLDGNSSNYDFQLIWTGNSITCVSFRMNSVYKTKDIEIIEKFEDGKWKKVKVTSWKGSQNNRREREERVEVLERVFKNADN